MISIFDIDLTWKADAACRTKDPGLFFGVRDGGHFTAGKAVCACCPVIDRCLDHGVRYEIDGLWGGMTPAERRTERWRRGIDLERITYDVGIQQPAELVHAS